MSVSGWETRSTTSAVSMDDRRARQQQQQAFASQQFASARSRHQPAAGDVPARHQSFPVQPPPHAHNGHHGHYAGGGDGPARRQSQMPSRPEHHQQQSYDPRLQQSGYREPSPPSPPYYDQGETRHMQQRHAPVASSRPSPSPSPQERKQYNPTFDPQHQRQQQSLPPPPPRPNGHYSPPQRDNYGDYRQPPNGPEQPYPQSNPQYHQHDQQEPEEEYFDSLPPPLLVRRGPSPAPIPVEMPDHAVRATASPSTASSSEDEPVNIDDVLLGKRWSLHVISHLYQFQRQELGDYAHELVKFLRGHAVMTYGQEFGYSVTIRFTSECVAFQVVEARDLHAEFLIETAEQPQRSARQRPTLEKQESSEPTDVRQRMGSFIVYFPKAAEDTNGVRLGPLVASRHGRPPTAAAAENGSDNSVKGDPKYVFLLRGNEELMAWVCSWVQRRFQCVVGLHVVRVTEENLRRVARNWVIEALEREERVEKARQRKAERLRKISAASGEDMAKPNVHKPHDLNTTTWPARAPLLLKYRSKTDTDVVKAFTMTMPWTNVRRVHALMDGGVGSALGSVPEVLERLEHLYFGNLKKDLAAMTLTGVQMDELEVDTQGKVKFYKSWMVHSVLQSFLDIFVVQQVPGPTEPMTTF